jgi:peroxiredoxin Q/BCP
VVLGVSADSVKKHANFKKKYDLPFTLLADTGHEIAKAYGVWAQKSMFGKKYMGINRTTFIIDAKGRIARVFEKVQTVGHAKEVADAVAEIR